MKRSISDLITIAAALPLLPLTLNGQTAGSWEQFNTEANARYWSILDFSDNTYYYPTFSENPIDPDLSFMYRLFVDDNGFLFSIFENTESGYDFFHGDLAAANVRGYSFDLVIQDASVISTIDSSFYSVPEGKYYYGPVLEVIEGFNSFVLDFETTTWKYFDTATSTFVEEAITPAALAHVNDFVIRCFPNSVDSGGFAVGVDNFKLLPKVVEPATETSATDGMFTLQFPLVEAQTYSILKSSDTVGLAEFNPILGEENISGSSPYSYSEEISEEGFFQVVTEGVFTPVPSLPDPNPPT